MENEFPPNSHTNRETRATKPPVETVATRKEVTRVTTGKARLRKKPLYKQFFAAFRPEDGKGFLEHTLLEVLVPGIKDAVADASTGAIENALGVHSRPRGRSRSGGGGYTSYSRMSTSRGRDRRDRDDDRRPSNRRETRVADDVREVILDTRVEADETLDAMFELLSKYDVVTMRDLLSLIGEPHNPTHEDWGWLDLRGARVHRVGGGYLLDLPRPEALD